MPIKENAKKALRQSLKRTARNKLAKVEIESLRIKVRKLLDAKKPKEAAGIMKKNTVARLKSRLMKKVNALQKA